MIVLSEIDNDLVLDCGDGRGACAGPRFNLHAASPVLIGLVAPIIVIGLIEPRVLSHAGFMLTVILVCALFAAVVIFASSVLSPGCTASVRFDRTSKIMTLHRPGMFANANLDIPFSQISTLKIMRYADCDGYGTAEPVAVLRSRQTVALPAATTEAQLRTLCTMLGFA